MAVAERKLKVAILVKRFTPTGGSEKYALEVAQRLAARGHEIDVYARDAEQRELKGLRFVKVPDRLGFSSVASLYSFARETSRLLAGRRYDVIHGHERGHMPQDISTLHSFSYRGSGYLGYPWWKKVLQVYLSPRSWLHLWLEAGQMAAPELAAVSRVISDDASRFYNRSSVEISPGVDLDRFNPERIVANRKEKRLAAGIKEEESVVLFVGSEFRRKGLDLLLEQIGPGMRLFVVGRDERPGYYQALARRLNIEAQVNFTGLVSDVMEYYPLADLVVLPSRSEAFGMSILEGMACGLPVAVSGNAGVAALICHGVNGFVFRDAAGLAEVLPVMKDRHRCRALGTAARMTAAGHGWDVKALQYEELYNRIAAQKIERP